MPAWTWAPSPTEFSTMISVMIPALGTPAAPIDARVAVITMMNCSPMPMGIP